MLPHSTSANSPFSTSYTAAAVDAVRHRYTRLSSPRARIERSLSTAGVAVDAEAPSCLFVGPIDTASKEMLEALYHQARDSYYSGEPLIVDDMFDKVELQLRLYGSKSVVKYPRCSIMRQSTYADAEGRKTLLRFWHWQLYGLCYWHLGVLPFLSLPSLPSA